MILKTVTFLCKTVTTYWYTTNQESKSIVYGFIKTIKLSGKTLYKLHLTKIF